MRLNAVSDPISSRAEFAQSGIRWSGSPSFLDYRIFGLSKRQVGRIETELVAAGLIQRTYLAGVLLTFWVLLMVVQLTFPKPQTAAQGPNLAAFRLEGTRITTGLGGLGQLVNLPRGVELANCPVPNPGGGDVCITTRTTR